ncbi:zinc knuckle [Colletotrichum asianum]
MTGAFNRVVHYHLLCLLVEYGVPIWMIQFIWEFLSRRSTTVRLHGKLSKKFWIKIGVPQGSPLSPILFVSTWSSQVYRRLTRFTSLHGTEFSADKTQIIHLCQSRKAPPIVNVMPNVSGFPTEAKDDAIKTLAKVRQKMYQMRRVCGSTWGPDVLKLRHQYITSVRPIFAYACALWYVVRRTKGTRCKWSLCQALVNKLETEQTQCLKQVFGAYQRVSGDILCKEFFVEKLCVFLAGSHPLNVAYREAKALVWMVADDELQLRIRADPKLAKNPALRRLRRKQLIRDVVKKMSHFKSQDLWQKFVIRYLSQAAAFIENCPAIQGIWGQHNLKIWVDMPKAQSTILLHIRTGFNGLNATLHFMGLAPSHMCPCGKGAHNAKHLFLHCKLLEDARKHLRKALPELTFENLVNHRPRVAADFAIPYFGIPQFQWTTKHVLSPLFDDLQGEEEDGESSSPSWRTKEIFHLLRMASSGSVPSLSKPSID